MVRGICCCQVTFLLIALLVWPGDAVGAEKPAARVPVPAEDDRAKSLALLREVFSSEIDAAKKPEQKAQLAGKLLRQALDSRRGSADQYVLLRVARDLATSAGDPVRAASAIEKMTAAFDVDPASLHFAASRKLRKKVRSADQRKSFVRVLIRWADEAVESDDYKTAQALLKTALVMARKGRETDLVRDLAARQKEVGSSAKRYAKAKLALEKLRDRPKDPAANLAAGRYYCLVKGDWKKGIPMLALGGESELARLGRNELAARDGDQDTLALADGWFALAEGAASDVKEALLSHAARWYQEAFPKEKGLRRVRAEKRLARVKKMLADIGAAKGARRRRWASFPGMPGLQNSVVARVQITGAMAKLKEWPAPKEAAPADARGQAIHRFNAMLRENYLVTPVVPYQGSAKFKVLSDGVVVVGIWQKDWGDRRFSGGSWRKEVQSREQLIRLGWKPLGIELVDGALFLAARQCRAGEELFIRTKKYATPRIFIPKASIPKASIPKDGRTR